MNDLQHILLGLSDLNKHERDLLSYVIQRANHANNYEVTVGVRDRIFNKNETAPLYLINKVCNSLFSKILCFKMHQEHKNTLSFRCIRFFRRLDTDTYTIGLSFVLVSVLHSLKGYFKTDSIEQLASLKKPIAKYFFLVHHQNLSLNLDEFRKLLQFSETNKEKRNWMHRHVNPAFQELQLKFEGLYNLSYRRVKYKIVGIDLLVK